MHITRRTGNENSYYYRLYCTADFCIFLLRKLFYHLVDKRIARFQSDLISKQTVEIQNMYRQMQEWRHDYRNHIQNMKNRLDGDQGELEQYLDELADDLTQTDTSIQTGNVMADAVLNSKLSVAEQKHSAQCQGTHSKVLK